MSQDKISVCMATYNGEKYIQQQIDSILPQLRSHDELIISDDQSTDKTIEIIHSYNDPRIKLFTNKQRQYICSNFQNALSKASGEYIILSDQDDVWLSNKIDLIYNKLKQYTLVITNCKIVDSNLAETGYTFFNNERKFHAGILYNIWKNSYIGCCMGFRSDILKYILPFPTSDIMHDLWIAIIAEHYGSICYINTPTLLYRRHGLNASTSSEKSTKSLWFKFTYRIKTIYYFIKRILEK